MQCLRGCRIGDSYCTITIGKTEIPFIKDLSCWHQSLLYNCCWILERDIRRCFLDRDFRWDLLLAGRLETMACLTIIASRRYKDIVAFGVLGIYFRLLGYIFYYFYYLNRVGLIRASRRIGEV